MTRAAFTVHMKPAEGRNDGINYDAVMLNPTFEDHTMRPMLSFVCSGRQMTVPASEVAGVTFYEGGTTHCGVCDEPLNQNIVQQV